MGSRTTEVEGAGQRRGEDYRQGEWNSGLRERVIQFYLEPTKFEPRLKFKPQLKFFKFGLRSRSRHP